jgi:hypothetical protein
MQPWVAASAQYVQVGLVNIRDVTKVMGPDCDSKQTHQRLRNLGKARKDGDNASTHTSECSICLMSIAVSIH